MITQKQIDELAENGMNEIADLKNHLAEIYELIAGDDAINRFKPDEMIDYIKVLNEQIAEWENDSHESFMPKELTKELKENRS